MDLSQSTPWRVGDEWIGRDHTEIMGIVNCTPDSFFDGGKHATMELATEHAVRLLDEGALILDIGGESTRPGSQPVSAEPEISRVIPVIQNLAALQSQRHFFLSVDTVKAKVAVEAVRAGAQIVNDVSMGADPDMAALVADSSCSLVLNHTRGKPKVMQLNPFYNDVLTEVGQELRQAAQHFLDCGVAQERICLDPGIGFGKRLKDNYTLIAKADHFHALGFPLLYGMSRKSYIGNTDGLEKSDRLIPSVVSATLVAQQGVGVVRVHDVAATREALIMLGAITGEKNMSQAKGM